MPGRRLPVPPPLEAWSPPIVRAPSTTSATPAPASAVPSRGSGRRLTRGPSLSSTDGRGAGGSKPGGGGAGGGGGGVGGKLGGSDMAGPPAVVDQNGVGGELGPAPAASSSFAWNLRNAPTTMAITPSDVRKRPNLRSVLLSPISNRD